MGAQHSGSQGYLSSTRKDSEYVSYKRGSRKIYNPQILDAMIPTNQEGLQGNILLDMGKWKQYQMEHICPLISEWNVKQGLWLGWNNEPLIIYEIVGIRFQFMQSLSLDRNAICSIQLLSEMWMPNLSNLNLQHNNIVYMKPLTKLNQSLQKLQINNNPIRDASNNLYAINSRKLQKLDVSIHFGDLIKMNIQKIEQLWIKRKVYDWQNIYAQNLAKKAINPFRIITA